MSLISSFAKRKERQGYFHYRPHGHSTAPANAGGEHKQKGCGAEAQRLLAKLCFPSEGVGGGKKQLYVCAVANNHRGLEHISQPPPAASQCALHSAAVSAFNPALRLQKSPFPLLPHVTPAIFLKERLRTGVPQPRQGGIVSHLSAPDWPDVHDPHANEIVFFV